MLRSRALYLVLDWAHPPSAVWAFHRAPRLDLHVDIELAGMHSVWVMQSSMLDLTAAMIANRKKEECERIITVCLRQDQALSEPTPVWPGCCTCHCIEVRLFEEPTSLKYPVLIWGMMIGREAQLCPRATWGDAL